MLKEKTAKKNTIERKIALNYNNVHQENDRANPC